MILRYGLLAAACILMVLAAGCTSTPAQPAPAQTPVTTASPAAPSVSPSEAPDASCSNDVCSAIPATVPATRAERSLRIVTSPQRYSLMMSSTPGIGLEPVATGFNATTATFSWNASYGQFLSWDARDYTVDQLGSSASGPGKKLYWSFSDSHADTKVPVTITVTAKDPVSGELWGTSVVTLAWDGDSAVTVQN